MFNFLTTGILLPLEIVSDFLLILSDRLTSLIPFENAEQIAKANFMGPILNPFTEAFILLDMDAVDRLNKGDSNVTQIAKRCCEKGYRLENSTQFVNFTNQTTNLTITTQTNVTFCITECSYACMPMLKGIGDTGTGLFWIIFSVGVLIGCLFGIVKVLSLLIVGPIAKGVRKAINASLPGKLKWFTQVILFVIALLLTILVQSSNIITATLVPLCGIGMVSLQRVYVMTLGSNIGTTFTGILSAFTLAPSAMEKGMQLAFVYTFFNVLGVIFWLPVPLLRFPKRLARKLGNIVFEYRWFLYFYIFSVYFILPIFVFGLALIPYWIGLAIFGIPVILLFLGYLVLLILRRYYPKIVPQKLKNFDWLPIWMRSLEPYDKKVKRIRCCCKRKKKKVQPSESGPKVGEFSTGPNDLDGERLDEIEREAREDRPSIIPNIIRKLSVIDGGLVTEAERKHSSRRPTIVSNDSSSEDEYDSRLAKEYRRRKSRVHSIFEAPETGATNSSKF
jgi:sodium-dependent phosphate cotransporter